MPVICKFPQRGGGKLNVFTQLDEPKIKDGIWIKTDEKYKNIVIDEDIYEEQGEWKILDDRLPCDFFSTSNVVYKNKLHVIGNRLGRFYNSNLEGKYADRHYEYDGKAWTRLDNLPYKAVSPAVVVCNNQIHLMSNDGYCIGVSKNKRDHYIYDDNAWTKIEDIPFIKIEEGTIIACSCKDSVYIINPSYNTNGVDNNCYQWHNNVWTTKSKPPKDLLFGLVCYNLKIHLFCGIKRNSDYSYTRGQYHYVYDPDTDTYMQLSNVPIIAYSTCVCIEYNGKLYINITDTNKIGHMYEYNINKDAYTEIENPPSNFRGDFISYNGYLNCLGTYDKNNECEENKYHQVYKVNMKNLFNESNTVYILNNKQNNQYKTCFISSYKQIMGVNNKFFLEFNDAFYCDKNKKIDKNQEAYYGDGTQWIRFK